MVAGFVTLAAAAALMLVLTIAARRVARRTPSAVPEAVDPVDVADIDALFHEVEVDEAHHRDEVVAARLRPLVDRRVPVRCIEAVPDLRVARVRFADGTAVVVKGHEPGDVGVLAALVRSHSVLAGACSTDSAGTHLEFGFTGGHRTYSVLVAGLDQPD